METTMTSPDAALEGAHETARERAARNLLGALVGGLLIAALEFAATRASVGYPLEGQLGWLVRLALHWGLAALPLGLAFDIAERRSPAGAPSRLAYAIAVAAGAGAGALVMALHGKLVDPAISQTAVGLDLPLPDRFLYGFWQLGFWGTVGAALHSAEQRRRRSSAALRAAELARLRGEQRLSDAHLAALHAQVEPQFLLATLDRIERLYATDAGAADRVLDELIRFLREAIPVLRRGHSTVGEECRLLQTYLGVIGTGAGDALITEVDPASRGAAMPPGLLVSLAQKILDAAPDREPRFELRTTHSRGAVTLELTATVDPAGRVDALQKPARQAGQRLAQSHGPGSSVTVMHVAEGRLTLRIALIDHRGD
jgi:hypothetical protein